MMAGGPFSRLDLDVIEHEVKEHGFDALNPVDTLRLVAEVRRLWRKVEGLEQDSELLNSQIEMMSAELNVEIVEDQPFGWHIVSHRILGSPYSLAYGATIRAAIEAAVQKWSKNR